MDSQWLKLQFELNPERSKTGLAKALNLEPPAISKILNSARQIKAHEYITMRQYFGLPVDGDRAQRSASSYTIESFGADHGLADTSDDKQGDDWVIPADILSARTSAAPDQIKIFQNKESLMDPEFKQGESLLVDLSDHTPSPSGTFVLHDGFGYMVRFCEYVPKSNPPEIRVSAHHPDFMAHSLPLTDIDVIGRVIAKLQMV